MTRAVFAIPGDIQTVTGGYIYDRRVMALLPALGIATQHLPLPASYPFPTPEDIAQTRALIGAVAPGDVIVADGLAWGAVPPDLARACGKQTIALCHHPLGLESGLDAVRSRALIDNERAVLAACAHVIVTSGTTAQTIEQDFAVPRAKITVAEPGTDPAARSIGSGGAPHIFAVGSVVPRKGFDLLVEALAPLAPLPWTCTIAGSLTRAPGHVAQVRDALIRHGLDDRIFLIGECSDAELEQLYAGADMFVSASHYEGYGMVLSEALARGMPIITTTGGAAAHTVPDAAAIKVLPGDSGALSDAIALLLLDESLRRTLAAAAWSAGEALPRWENTAGLIAAAIRKVAPSNNPEIKA